MIRQSDRFTQKEFFYALDLNSLKVKPIHDSALVGISMNALWFKREKGMLSICKGTIADYLKPEQEVTVEYFMDNYRSGRYGGSTQFKWDGEKMWSKDNIYTKLVQAHDSLDPLLQKFLNNQEIPAGYEGWYSVKD